MNEPRYATIHILERNGKGGESLWEVCVKVTPDQDQGLESGDRLSYQEVIGRARKIIFDELAKRTRPDDYPEDYLDELWP